VDTLQAEIRRHDHLVTFGDAQQGGIVADSDCQLWKFPTASAQGESAKAVSLREWSVFFGF
jgi:hypothetical protein